MRVLFTTFPAPSHFFPMVPLAWALRAAGHEVAVASQPGFLQAVRGTGLPAVKAGADVDLGAVWYGPGETDPDWRGDERARSSRAMRMFAAVAEAMADDVIAFARVWRPDVIVYEPRAYAGLVAAHVLDLPLVRHLWGTDYTLERWDVEGPSLAPLLERYGVPDADHLGTVTVDVCPPRLQSAAAPNRTLMRYVPFNGSGTVPDLPSGPRARPRVCVTWGTTFVKQTGHLDPVRHAVEALCDLDVDVLVAIGAGHRHLLGELPRGALVLESVPLHLSLPACDAIVHQGGAGTMITSAVLGVPQLVVHALADEPLNARQVAAAGAGRSLPLAEAAIDRIRAEAGALLEDAAYGAAARSIRDEVAALPPPAALVDTVVALGAGGRRPRDLSGV
ncbi:glycosyl transferase [Actinomadura rubrobrunea]|uniref:Glycosyl transferase n=1 Tax=Actinomadura rubrobrunea TaxID=115335 RepID=A0A9W6PVG4_9ACTN|nr:nucleotide disphospho-sugar-binding domain-containing protein [Actinomadura rubrobrunea]GLW63941.1 glycosyl transferase [Actinomadura rubrobrunea]